MFWILALPGLIAAYFLFLRPVLAALPQLKKFYAEADGFWMKLSALGWHSATIAWGYAMAAVGAVLTWIEPLAAALGDPDIKAQIMNTLQTNPKVLAYFMMGVSAITIVARLRSITRAA